MTSTTTDTDHALSQARACYRAALEAGDADAMLAALDLARRLRAQRDAAEVVRLKDALAAAEAHALEAQERHAAALAQVEQARAALFGGAADPYATHGDNGDERATLHDASNRATMAGQHMAKAREAVTTARAALQQRLEALTAEAWDR